MLLLILLLMLLLLLLPLLLPPLFPPRRLYGIVSTGSIATGRSVPGIMDHNLLWNNFEHNYRKQCSPTSSNPYAGAIIHARLPLHSMCART